MLVTPFVPCFMLIPRRFHGPISHLLEIKMEFPSLTPFLISELLLHSAVFDPRKEPGSVCRNREAFPWRNFRRHHSFTTTASKHENAAFAVVFVNRICDSRINL